MTFTCAISPKIVPLSSVGLQSSIEMMTRRGHARLTASGTAFAKANSYQMLRYLEREYFQKRTYLNRCTHPPTRGWTVHPAEKRRMTVLP